MKKRPTKKKMKKTRVMKKKKMMAKKKMKKMKKVKAKKIMKKKKPARAAKAAKARLVMKKVTAAKVKKLGKVVHYYDRIGVAIVKVDAPFKMGDRLMLKAGKKEFTQVVGSLQVNHQPIQVAKKGDVVGMKVDREAREGTMVMEA